MNAHTHTTAHTYIQTLTHSHSHTRTLTHAHTLTHRANFAVACRAFEKSTGTFMANCVGSQVVALIAHALSCHARRDTHNYTRALIHTHT